jgi:hypothetical protein
MDKSEIKILINDCLDRFGKMSNWERDFIESIDDQFSEKKFLTTRQEETLNKIWEKVT